MEATKLALAFLARVPSLRRRCTDAWYTRAKCSHWGSVGVRIFGMFDAILHGKAASWKLALHQAHANPLGSSHSASVPLAQPHPQPPPPPPPPSKLVRAACICKSFHPDRHGLLHAEICSTRWHHFAGAPNQQRPPIERVSPDGDRPLTRRVALI